MANESFRVIPYEDALATRWDAFVTGSKNGTFLFLRGYQDYHRDRFPDGSLVVTNADGEWVAVLPANRSGDRLVSHGGLTYGGFVVSSAMTTPAMVGVFEATLAALARDGVKTLVYKTIPSIYHRLPAEEDRYALFRHRAVLHRRDVLSVVLPGERGPVQERRRRGVKKALKAGLSVRRSNELAAFWPILEATLAARHEARPVHSLAEMEMLADRFSESIQLMGVYQDQILVAGTVLYRTATVDHAQYIAASELGRELGGLDILFDSLIVEAAAQKKMFDFGISNVDDGHTLNVGLIEQKEGFGARAIVHDHYTLPVSP